MAPRFREFHVETDAAGLLHSGWLEQGERPIWFVSAGVDHYMVGGSLPNGSTRTAWSVTVRILAQVLLFPIMIAWWVLYTVFWAAWGRSSSRDGYSGGGIFWPHAHPKVIVFGADARCMAVRCLPTLSIGPDAGVWVLTDRRFARVALSPQFGEGDRDREVRRHYGVEASLDQCRSMPPEPMLFRTELELPISQVRRETATRQLSRRFRRPRSQRYHRISFSDGSGFDIAADSR